MTTDPMASTVESVRREALVRRAQERLIRIDDMRDAYLLSEQGKSQRDIAEALCITQPRVHRMLKAADFHSTTEESPEEMILRATVRGTSRKELVARLQGFHYTFTAQAPEPFEGSKPGTWEQVRVAYLRGFLTEDEYERVRSVVHPTAGASVRHAHN